MMKKSVVNQCNESKGTGHYDYSTQGLINCKICSGTGTITIQNESEEKSEGNFQSSVKPWLIACFGEKIASDKLERSDRLIEESLELAQSIGYTKERAHALVDYVFSREKGEPHQEAGGVMLTLAALCLACNLDMHAAGTDELKRVWTKIDKIRSKQAAKPSGSALPQ